ncbi:excinuclease ABC subunit UvrA [Alphaproteobacteria bacterium]|jgi:excinuclease ABC subunit A|nr:excinuclease ABC subunit UvrA [Alphaproteobacteria bacterium]|tara:strand:- start:4594 stop:7467 length:2874 start_codon:yes stop_codon:yes gene_type:complete
MSKTVEMKQFLKVRGANEHNLKNVDIDIPKDQLIVMTGVSGSGKSSLAFDTIYAEGQRRYVESLSAYARQFLQMMQKPDVESIEGLSPAISIEQKSTNKNPRSTVGTVTEIYDYMRLLWARIGVPYSPATGLPIESQTVSQMVDKIFKKENDSKIYLLAPIVRGRKGEYRKEFIELRKKGFQRLRINDEFYDIEEIPTLDRYKKHYIEVVVDRLVIKKSTEEDNKDLLQRLADSIEITLQLSDGLLYTLDVDSNEKEVFSSNFSCPESGFTIDEIEPRIFSFNNPAGACDKCDGLGNAVAFDLDLVVPDQNITFRDGAIAPWSVNTSKLYIQTLESLGRHYKFNIDDKFSDIPEETKQKILYGSGDDKIEIIYNDGTRVFKSNKAFEGIIPNLIRRLKESESKWVKEELGRYQSDKDCEKCNGKRLKLETLCVKINEHDIADVSRLTIEEARGWFLNLNQVLNEQELAISKQVLKEINDRLGFLTSVGLSYLSISRNSGTLSGGESQRIRLASQIGSGLSGVLYVLDEPSIGLHQRDNERLLHTLQKLRDLGNTVIVVEHDEEAILIADHVIDIGPGAGINGGKIIAQGTPKEVQENKNSITGNYLSGIKSIAIPKSRRKINPNKNITLRGASGNNLQDIDVEFPLGILTCVTGVSGGGKSTLVIQTLQRSLSKILNGNSSIPSPYKSISGISQIDKIIDIDQSPIGRTPRSNPATYTGAFNHIRDWFAGLPEAKARGYLPGRFSFNVKGGRCEVCQGDGVIKIEMHFLPDVYVQCDQCKGKRYNRETLEVKWRDKSISDVLDMTVSEGAELFKAVPLIHEKLETLERVGLGYIKIGQRSTTLSGGEAQRIKLAKELSRKGTGRTIYILDEPTTGLHFHDIKKLLEVMQELVDNGNTMIVIEHNLDVIKTADHVIDLGPEGGDKGGYIVAKGTPEEVSKVKESHTGIFLKKLLNSSK